MNVIHITEGPLPVAIILMDNCFTLPGRSSEELDRQQGVVYHGCVPAFVFQQKENDCFSDKKRITSSGFAENILPTHVGVPHNLLENINQ